MALFKEDTRKLAWASDLFEQGPCKLKDQTYLWARAWNQELHTGPYGYIAYLSGVEPQLIGLVYSVFPDHLLNKDGVPNDAPINAAEFAFETVSR